MSCIQETADLICPEHARSKRSEDSSRVIQPTPVPKGGGFVSSALLTAHGRVLDLGFKKNKISRYMRSGTNLELAMKP